MDEIKPCPFCACEVVRVYPRGDYRFVFCPQCMACGPRSLSDGTAVSDWNRVARPAKEKT